jgi:hypothetical protein
MTRDDEIRELIAKWRARAVECDAEEEAAGCDIQADALAYMEGHTRRDCADELEAAIREPDPALATAQARIKELEAELQELRDERFNGAMDREFSR